MTKPMSEDLNTCYTLLFTGECELRRNCMVKALLCFEDSRKRAECLIKQDSIYKYCYFRSLRKECQTLRHLGLQRRSFTILEKAIDYIDEDWASNEQLLILLQLYDLSETFNPTKTEEYYTRLLKESEALKE